jgi:MFS family permease
MEDTSAERVTKTLLAAQFTNSLGDGAFYVTSAVYFTTVAGLDPAEVGAGLSCGWTVGFLSAAALGAAADRVGLRGSAVGLAVATALTLCALAEVRSFPGFLVCAGCYAVAQSGLTAVRQALLVQEVPVGLLLETRARLQVRTNAAVGLGAAVGGLALSVGRPSAFVLVLLADAAAFLVTGFLLTRLPRPAPSSRPRRVLSPAGLPLAVLGDRPFVLATALNVVLYLYMPVLSVLAPLWVVGHTAAPTWSVAALFVLNTTGVMAVQRAAAGRVTDLASAARSVRRGGCLLGVGCLVVWAATLPTQPVAAVLVLLIAGAVLTAGEVQLASGSWEIGYALADPHRPGQWQGFYSSSVPAARALGPTVLVGLVLTWTGPGWLALGALQCLAGLALAATATSRRTTSSRP